MHADATAAILAQFAVIAALLAFAAVLLAGGWLVRRLRLPVDLPDGPRFEPAPPAAVAGGDKAVARAAAARQARRAACGRAAREAAEAAFLARAHPGPAAEAAAAAAQAAELAFRDDDLERAEAAVAQQRAEALRQRALAEAATA